MNAKQKLTSKVASQTTEALVSIARHLNLKTSREEIIVQIEVERELEKRLSSDEFVALMSEFEAELMAV
jgi:hypothetical protein